MTVDFSKVPKEFNPSIFHPFYFIRKGLLKGIAQHAHKMNGKLLDFGCGSKPYQSLFNVDEYIGVDFENPGHSHENEQIDFYYDGKHLPFENSAFDHVLCSEVVEHVFNFNEVLQEINRVLKPNGTLLLTCPFVWSEHEVPHDFARYTQFALKDILEKNGFEILSFNKSGNFIKSGFQLFILYFYQQSKSKWLKIPPLRWLYKFIFYFILNIKGSFLSWLLPNNSSLYLNNIVLAVKK